VSSLAYAALPLAFGAIAGKARNAIAVWMAFYLLLGGILEAMAHNLGLGWLAAFNPTTAVGSLAAGLFDVTLFRVSTWPTWQESLVVLLGYTALGFGVLLWRVRRAERAGLGGG
jgi:peptidoglycan/LPS O-acetylase OafA/YrhL